MLIGILTSYITKKNKKYSHVDDFDSVKELVEYYGCKYKKMSNSDEENFSKDIYLEFMKDPIDENGNTSEILYKNMISALSSKMNEKNYRIVDESRNLTVRVYFNKEDKTISYTINNVNNYFGKLISLHSLNNLSDEKILDREIRSSTINDLIRNNWIRRNTNLGNSTSKCGSYEYFENQGYKIRIINNKVYNIVFNKNYNQEIIDGIKVGMTNEEIKKILGDPTFENTSEISIIGYKLNDIYLFCNESEISVYRVEDFSEQDNEKFANIFTLFTQNLDYNTFLSELTSLYPDYSIYEQENNQVKIRYPLRGFEINLGQYVRNNGMTVYNNYIGKITKETSIDDIKKEKVLPSGTYLSLSNNLVFIDETDRALNDYLLRNPYSYVENTNKFILSEDYAVKYNDIYNEYEFYKRDKEGSDFSIRVTNSTGIFELTNKLFVYGVKNDGIYVIDVTNRNTSKIISSNGDCIINKVEDNVIYYDDTSIQISYN